MDDPFGDSKEDAKIRCRRDHLSQQTDHLEDMGHILPPHQLPEWTTTAIDQTEQSPEWTNTPLGFDANPPSITHIRSNSPPSTSTSISNINKNNIMTPQTAPATSSGLDSVIRIWIRTQCPTCTKIVEKGGGLPKTGDMYRHLTTRSVPCKRMHPYRALIEDMVDGYRTEYYQNNDKKSRTNHLGYNAFCALGRNFGSRPQYHEVKRILDFVQARLKQQRQALREQKKASMFFKNHDLISSPGSNVKNDIPISTTSRGKKKEKRRREEGRRNPQEKSLKKEGHEFHVRLKLKNPTENFDILDLRRFFEHLSVKYSVIPLKLYPKPDVYVKRLEVEENSPETLTEYQMSFKYEKVDFDDVEASSTLCRDFRAMLNSSQLEGKIKETGYFAEMPKFDGMKRGCVEILVRYKVKAGVNLKDLNGFVVSLAELFHYHPANDTPEVSLLEQVANAYTNPILDLKCEAKTALRLIHDVNKALVIPGANEHQPNLYGDNNQFEPSYVEDQTFDYSTMHGRCILKSKLIKADPEVLHDIIPHFYRGIVSPVVILIQRAAARNGYISTSSRNVGKRTSRLSINIAEVIIDYCIDEVNSNKTNFDRWILGKETSEEKDQGVVNLIAAFKDRNLDQNALYFWQESFGDQSEVTAERFYRRIKEYFLNINMPLSVTQLEAILLIIGHLISDPDKGKPKERIVRFTRFAQFVKRFGPFERKMIDNATETMLISIVDSPCDTTAREKSTYTLAMVPWYHGRIKEEDIKRLIKKNVGKFMVREPMDVKQPTRFTVEYSKQSKRLGEIGYKKKCLWFSSQMSPPQFGKFKFKDRNGQWRIGGNFKEILSEMVSHREPILPEDYNKEFDFMKRIRAEEIKLETTQR
ncbi:hypothetical protein AAMO2058_001260500 [Amorphochlora amoebiformis]